MRALVVSDIHANYEALRRVPENVDRVLCLWDLVDYGPNPKPCIDWVRDRKALAVRGNHDNAVAFHVNCGCAPPMREVSGETRALMWDLLDPVDLDYPGSRPLTADVTLDGVRFRLVHATPSDPLHTYLRDGRIPEPAAEVRRREPQHARAVGVSERDARTSPAVANGRPPWQSPHA